MLSDIKESLDVDHTRAFSLLPAAEAGHRGEEAPGLGCWEYDLPELGCKLPKLGCKAHLGEELSHVCSPSV